MKITIENIADPVTKITWNSGELNQFMLDKFPDINEFECTSNKITTLNLLSAYVNLRKIDCSYNKITSLEPLSKCINLQELDCHNNNISSLEPLLKCINLQKLNCSNNKLLSLEPLSFCINLRVLYCSYDNSDYHNPIMSLESLSACVNLQELYCDGNQIASLDPLSTCINLRVLRCCYNQITSLEPLLACTNLEELNCGHNQITSLEPLSVCTNLQKLYCYENQITSLEPLSVCVNIQLLFCIDNQITSLNPIIYLRRLEELRAYNNPIGLPTIQVQRFLDRFRGFNKNSSIYIDGQNVHDVTIQKSVCDSLQNLLKDKKIVFNLQKIIDSPLDEITKAMLIEYCQDTAVHSIHLVTYQELLGYVWNRIASSEHRDELFKILTEQISDSECKCFTGRFNRTLSVLVGFYDDIVIEISDNSRIGAIIIATKDKINPYNIEDHKKLALTNLQEAGYSQEEVKPWIDAIEE